jgi:hypothetical protein
MRKKIGKVLLVNPFKGTKKKVGNVYEIKKYGPWKPDRVWSKTYKKWFYDYGNYYLDSKGKKHLPIEFPNWDLVSRRQK